jgi:acetolactate decarboxylase
MKDVMWKGELFSKIKLDTIKPKKGLYGLGPEAYLRGEILINNGKTYVSRVLTDSTMTVTEIAGAAAPFFVYTNVNEWSEIRLPSSVKSIKDLEYFIDSKTKNQKRPFAFRLEGSISKATIHIQNLPKDTKVSSPKEAHQGQTNYVLKNQDVEIIGFFSTEHQGIFTHHDSFLHMHLITKNEKQMGHLDDVDFDEMMLLLPKS